MHPPLRIAAADASARTAVTPDLPREMPGSPSISSDLLLQGARELVIRHQGGEYHLRLTRNDKLILTR
ncbi:MAG: hemin uptake protein HemP [Xanthomonadaceae bacterium]|nr:hemin uptake protein HemP [Xanthomonadaceae bacterium]MDE1963082.1 hemin uptake protein HemP [Xanthomonadaceae bacterium]